MPRSVNLVNGPSGTGGDIEQTIALGAHGPPQCATASGGDRDGRYAAPGGTAPHSATSIPELPTTDEAAVVARA